MGLCCIERLGGRGRGRLPYLFLAGAGVAPSKILSKLPETAEKRRLPC